MSVTYCKRVWLNPPDSPSTGAVVAYYGQKNWESDDKNPNMMFLQINDCHQSIRLHRAYRDSDVQFIEKMRVLSKVAGEFADFLQKECENNG